MRTSKQLRALVLTVAEVEDMQESLIAARALKDLSGRQRQQLEDVQGRLELAMTAAHGGVVNVPVELLVEILRSAIMTQQWLGHMMRELLTDDENE